MNDRTSHHIRVAASLVLADDDTPPEVLRVRCLAATAIKQSADDVRALRKLLAELAKEAKPFAMGYYDMNGEHIETAGLRAALAAAKEAL